MAMKSEANEIKQRKQFIRQVVTTAMLVGYVLYTYKNMKPSNIYQYDNATIFQGTNKMFQTTAV